MLKKLLVGNVWIIFFCYRVHISFTLLGRPYYFEDYLELSSPSNWLIYIFFDKIISANPDNSPIEVAEEENRENSFKKD